MSNSIITAEDARRARTSLYLSQSKISEAIGAHRTKYALFEVKRYIFTEKEQLTLRKHFESLGYVFFDNTILPSFAEPVLPPRNDIDFTFDLPGCIEGKITDVSAVPIPNLEIALFDNETGRFKTYTYANASGEYEFNYLLPNTYKVKVLSENYCSE